MPAHIVIAQVLLLPGDAASRSLLTLEYRWPAVILLSRAFHSEERAAFLYTERNAVHSSGHRTLAYS